MRTKPIIIDRNISEEEMQKDVEEFEKRFMTEEEEKQLDKDIRDGLIPGYVKPDGTWEMLR